MTLERFLSENGLTDAAFAAKVGRDRTSVTRWRRGDSRPDWEALRLICEATNGVVTPNDFLPDADPQRPFAAPGGDDEAANLKPNEAA